VGEIARSLTHEVDQDIKAEQGVRGIARINEPVIAFAL